MKKLYRKGTVHPSEQLSFLPATILTLTAALSPGDREVLAYLISCSSNNFSAKNKQGALQGDHPPLFHCSCFRCYMTYWVRWDSSPNNHLIHQILDAFEDCLAHTSKPIKKGKRNKRGSTSRPAEFISLASDESESVGESSGGDQVATDGHGVEDEKKGSVRGFVSFIGERIWGAWAQ